MTDKKPSKQSKEAYAAKAGTLLFAGGKVYEKRPDGTLKLILWRGKKP